MALCKNHDHVYFDKLCRTKKLESVQSLITATYQAKLNDGTKQDIARLLKNAYELFKFDSGTYDGGMDAFQSQYTIGHEMGIWINSDLDLSPLAYKVATNNITIKEYFDIVFLNYIQPIDNICYNLLFIIAEYLENKSLNILTKDNLKEIFDFATNNKANDINAVYNFLICTSYFSIVDSKTLKLEYSPSIIKSCCNLEFHNKKYEDVERHLHEIKDFVNYLQMDRRCPALINSLKLNKESNIQIPKTNFDFNLNKDSNYTDEELGNILLKYYNKYGLTGIHLFSIDYYSILNNYDKKHILEFANLQDSYLAEINKGIKIGLELNNVYNRKNAILENNLIGFNKIYYGIPGCGKSYKVASMLAYKDGFKEEANLNGIFCEVPEDFIFRTTFYLDYSNSDFVGQIYPVVEGDKVEYKPVPGPFTKALAKAFLHPEDMVYLVIEEINRGNAAAIFGDLFQLLDRLDESTNDRTIGSSEYPISNEFIESYFRLFNEGKISIDGENGKIKYKSGEVFIPNNLTIFATMNTSDQNVFPLDTAFKRRWDRERIIPIWENASHANLCIPFTDMTWENFAKTINIKMLENCSDGTVTQDKNLGPYFISKDFLVEPQYRYENSIENKRKLMGFMNNVIDYLFNDVTKFDHSILFNEKYNYDEIYTFFTTTLNSDLTGKEAKEYLTIFNNNIIDDVKDGNEKSVGDSNEITE